MTFGERLKELREERGLTQVDLALIINVDRSTIAGYETKGKQPDYEKLITLARHFDVLVDYLIGNGDIRKIGPSRLYAPDELKGILQKQYEELLLEQNIGYVKFTSELIKDQINPNDLMELVRVVQNVRKEKSHKE